MHWIYLIHEFHNLSWITEINELFHNILIYWDAPVFTNNYILYSYTKHKDKLYNKKKTLYLYGGLHYKDVCVGVFMDIVDCL